jgi:hypothetical protein
VIISMLTAATRSPADVSSPGRGARTISVGPVRQLQDLFSLGDARELEVKGGDQRHGAIDERLVPSAELCFPQVQRVFQSRPDVAAKRQANRGKLPVRRATLAQLLRADLLPEARVAPPEVRQLRTLLCNRVHAVLADYGYGRPAGCWSGPGRSDRTVHHGHISKLGPAWARWVLCEAAQAAKRHPDFAPGYKALARRRGKSASARR